MSGKTRNLPTEIFITGNWDANTNTTSYNEALESGIGNPDEKYRVTVAGNTNLDGINSWAINDIVYFDYYSRTWQKIDNQTNSGVTGSGTLNYIPLWTPSGTQLGNSIITQSAGGNAIQIGTTFLVDNTAKQVGIDKLSSLAASLHIVGSGATSGTISLLVENSSSLPILSARDDRRVGINTIAPAATLEVKDPTQAGIRITSVGGYSPYIELYTEAVGLYLQGTIQGSNGISFSPFGTERFVMGGVGMLFGSSYVTINSTIHNAGSLSETKITTVSVGVHAVLATEYIFNCTGTCTINLPSIAAGGIGIGKVYKIFAAEGVTVTVTPNGADTIDGAASATVIGWGMITLRCLSAGNWRIED